MLQVQWIERHLIRKKHKLYNWCDEICLKSKNLYNQANYIVRQEFVKNKKWIRYNELDKMLKSLKNEEELINYKLLSTKVSQQVLMLLDKNWMSFFKAIKIWSKNKSKFNALA